MSLSAIEKMHSGYAINPETFHRSSSLLLHLLVVDRQGWPLLASDSRSCRGIASDIIGTAYINVVDVTGKVGADGKPISHGMYEDPRMNCPDGIGCANA
ncbi:hypothetical protein GUITHDRAFT_152633 [Guillardia theta CCMP2712]|uniref:Uncharacterized protein n=1 Tax=Guillardia theta (strain CCMP2712) TaxID=905079 RepID=L1JBR6_GUITC|nr:hypothetical protein GUITHDRAFT_152633 [Guillardia theta CCMP2712]EKX45564.1 hypothetical protein GUITHDRAFT_152633 [Guillardia theta CCMP2712]|eukprot:XP_005832544.1 hypothetical protein GUITHDRAFT_152633 [Guillardia theta CCMP2712]